METYISKCQDIWASFTTGDDQPEQISTSERANETNSFCGWSSAMTQMDSTAGLLNISSNHKYEAELDFPFTKGD